MFLCKVIQDHKPFKWSSKWQEVIPSQKGNIVDSKGKAITATYTGSRYKVICEAQHTKIVHIKRLTQGILAIIFTLGIAYLCSNKVKSLLTKKHQLYICPIIVSEDELKKEKTVQGINNEQIYGFDEKKLQNIPRINELSTKKLVTPTLEPENWDAVFNKMMDAIKVVDVPNIKPIARTSSRKESKVVNFTDPMIDFVKKEIEFHENFDQNDPSEGQLWKAKIEETLKKIAATTNKEAWGRVYIGMGHSDFYVFDENKSLQIIDSDDVTYQSQEPLSSYVKDRLDQEQVDMFLILELDRREILAHILDN